jgi:hypothetical protein
MVGEWEARGRTGWLRAPGNLVSTIPSSRRPTLPFVHVFQSNAGHQIGFQRVAPRRRALRFELAGSARITCWLASC